jgi:NAD(P)-dependent dehydrogenase (short-subunit alcohol dehydrogenase family)
VTEGRLENKVAITFGGGRGIGRGCALAMAAEGAAVTVVDINVGNANAVADEITSAGGRAMSVGCDVGDREQVQAAIDNTVGTFGRLDGIVNLAYAGTGNGPLEHVDPDDLRRELEISVVGMFTTMTLAFPHLKAEGGSIVNFSSGAAIEGTLGMAVYAAAKQGVRGLGLVAAKEWGVHQIRVNTVCPLAMSPAVPEFFKTRPEGAFEETVAKVALGRFGDAQDDIGRAVAFLISDDAKFVTGQTIMLDGGQTHL